jgi:leader peptidase (prepilin peptidase)/N-methyltransferase
MQLFANICAVMFGLCLGSFANVVIYRVPLGKSIVTPPSACPACGARLTLLDLVPVFSWLLLRGRCRHCKAGVSARYPLVETACALLFLCMALYAGLTPDIIPLCLMAFVLLCVSVIDRDTQEIPDGLLIFGAAVGALWVAGGALLPLIPQLGLAFALAPAWHDALLGVVAGGLPLLLLDRVVILLLKKDGFGYGDMKLMAMAGLFIGWQGMPAAFFFAFISGAVYAAALMLTKRAQRGAYMAFGPFLCAGVLLALWLGEWFLEMMGVML